MAAKVPRVQLPTGFRLREGTLDQDVVVEMAKSYAWMRPGPADVFLDIGGHIGVVAWWATECGAGVVSYEPEEENYSLLRKNAPLAVCVRAALVADTYLQDTVTLYLSRTRAKQIHSLYIGSKQRTDTQEVPAVKISEAMRINPTIVKCDAEGAEYHILQEPLPDSVRALTVEYHFSRNDCREVDGPRLHRRLCRQFECLKVPKFISNYRASLGWYRRRGGQPL